MKKIYIYAIGFLLVSGIFITPSIAEGLNDLDDVIISSVDGGHILFYDEILNNWTNSQDIKTDTYTFLKLSSFHNVGGFFPYIDLIKSDKGTNWSYVTTNNGDTLGMIRFYGIDSGNNVDLGSYIIVQQDGSSSTRVPSKMLFYIAESTGVDNVLTLTNSDITLYGDSNEDGIFTIHGQDGQQCRLHLDYDHGDYGQIRWYNDDDRQWTIYSGGTGALQDCLRFRNQHIPSGKEFLIIQNSTGFFGINVTPSTYRMKFQNTASNSERPIAESWLKYSDERFKEILGNLPKKKVISFCENISFIRYHPIFNWQDENGTIHTNGSVDYSTILPGISAQELFNFTLENFGPKFAHSIVTVPDDEDFGYWSVNTDAIHFIFHRFSQIIWDRLGDLL